MASRQTTTLTIASGATDSQMLEIRNARALSITAPSALTGTVTLQAGSDATSAATFADVQSPPGTDITPAINKTTVLTSAPFPSIRLHSGSTELADRVFVVCLEIGE